MTRYSGPADPTTPCTFVTDKKTGATCGGPTYTLPSGSIWCPDEDAHPGGFFVKRVAFERTPARQAEIDAAKGDWRKQLPQRPTRTAKPRYAAQPTFISSKDHAEREAEARERKAAREAAERREDAGFDTGMDAFVRSDK